MVSRETSRPTSLTARQLEILDHMTRPGASMPRTAASLGISEHTIRNQLASAYAAHGVNSLAQLTRALLARRR
jgi:DNA-binding CsgD family transcriptional regulator